MKFLLTAFVLLFCMGCKDQGTAGTITDSTVHPTGLNEGAVISTDTAAYRAKDTSAFR